MVQQKSNDWQVTTLLAWYYHWKITPPPPPPVFEDTKPTTSNHIFFHVSSRKKNLLLLKINCDTAILCISLAQERFLGLQFGKGQEQSEVAFLWIVIIHHRWNTGRGNLYHYTTHWWDNQIEDTQQFKTPPFKNNFHFKADHKWHHSYIFNINIPPF